MSERTPTNGRPYYCSTCGLGFAEFMACEEPDCELETEAEALERAAQVGRNAKRQDPQGLGPKDEHAVAEGDAPNLPNLPHRRPHEREP